ncbi:MAG: hypothetical protein F4Y03_07755 [Alphaproteobacteria bacterium]|nr:hypothetical protein [Alphaproteobacteria bacterium]
MKCDTCEREFVISALGRSRSEDCGRCGLPFHCKRIGVGAARREALCIQPKHMSRWMKANDASGETAAG